MFFRILTLIFLFLTISEAKADEYIFSPKNCNFSVQFPNKYKTRELSLGGVSALGAASGRGAGNTRFGAECWPIEGKVSIQEIGRGTEQQANQREILVISNITETNDDKKIR